MNFKTFVLTSFIFLVSDNCFAQQISFIPAPVQSFTAEMYGGIAVADVNSDNRPDVVISGSTTSSSSSPFTKLYLNGGNAVFAAANGVNLVQLNYSACAFAQLNTDTFADLIIIGEGSANDIRAIWYSGDGAGQFNFGGTFQGGAMHGSISVADVDNDLDMDVLLTGLDNSYNYNTKLYLNDGAGNFTASSNSFQGMAFGASDFADVDGDNDPDLFITGTNAISQFSQLYRDSAGIYTLDTSNVFPGLSSSACKFADIDGDLDNDLLITGTDGLNAVTNLYKNNGTGHFTLVSSTNLPNLYLGTINFADVDNDNDQDLLLTGDDLNSGITQLFANDGNGNFTPVTNLPFAAVSNSAAAFADVNADGLKDLVISGLGNSLVTALYLNTTCINTASSISPVVCQSYTSPSGNYTYTASNTYLDTIPNSKGCDSVITIHLTINPLPSVSFTLPANDDTVCLLDNSFALSGATPAGGSYSGSGVSAGQFDPPTAGIGLHTVYYTYTDSNTCTTTDSASINVELCTGITASASAAPQLSLFPNPASSFVTITMDETLLGGTAAIYDITGKKMTTVQLKTVNSKLETENYSNGIYLVTIENEKGRTTKKLIIQK